MDDLKFLCWDKIDKKFVPLSSVKIEGVELPTLAWSIKPLDERYVVLRCTGVKDKNGEYIYDGYIIIEEVVNNSLKTEKKTKIVFWFKSQSCFKLKSLDDKEHSWLLNFKGSLQPVYEKIGNIYENPELLK